MACVLIHSCKMPKESETTRLKVDESDGCLVMRRMSSGVVANLELENAPSFLPSLPSFLPSLPLEVLFCSLAVLDPRVGHTMDVLSPFIPVLCHSD